MSEGMETNSDRQNSRGVTKNAKSFLSTRILFISSLVFAFPLLVVLCLTPFAAFHLEPRLMSTPTMDPRLAIRRLFRAHYSSLCS